MFSPILPQTLPLHPTKVLLLLLLSALAHAQSTAMRMQIRTEVSDVFNHANFGQPGNVVGSQAFGRIMNIRFPNGDSGSSRHIQFTAKLAFF